jgi:hypothetical protein
MTTKADQASAVRPGQTRPYDLVKEFVIAVVVVALLTVTLAVLFSSPDEKALTLRDWAAGDGNDFVATATAELAGASTSAQYGAPYNNTPGAGQKVFPIHTQSWTGVRIPVNSAKDLVLDPLAAVPGDPALSSALSQYRTASSAQQNRWAAAYADALSKAAGGDPAKTAPGDYGPVPLLVNRELILARSGGLDGLLLSHGAIYQSDYTKPLLFLADGAFLADHAKAQHLAGNQWGMTNETGNYPGQAWLWLYTFWYQIKPFSTSGNADALIWVLMAILSTALVCVPFIPGLRSLPRYLGVHRLIWRQYYKNPGADTPHQPSATP